MLPAIVVSSDILQELRRYAEVRFGVRMTFVLPYRRQLLGPIWAISVETHFDWRGR